MTTLDTHFASYDDYHKTKGNKVTHYLGIPLIVFSAFGLLSHIPLPAPDWFTIGLVAWLFSSAYYVKLDKKRGAQFSVLTLVIYLVSRWIGWKAHVALFVVGWILQLVGHYKYEKKAPAFITNLSHLLIGPFWIYCNLMSPAKPTN
ncbi:MAG: Mpo1-like protein [Bdellovibrionota bacterium]